MTNPTCQSIRKGQDCISRNARLLCDVCTDLLTEAEHREREIVFFVADTARKAQRELATLKRAPRRCMRPRPTDTRTCSEKGLLSRCGFCISQMTEKELLDFATKVIDGREAHRQYWEEYEEANEYAEELKAAGVRGTDWNIECCDSEETTAYKFWLFMASRPCWMHSEAANAA